MRRWRWAGGKTRLDHVINVDIWKKAHNTPDRRIRQWNRLRWFGHVFYNRHPSVRDDHGWFILMFLFLECDASSDVCLGDDIWSTGCCPCITSPLSTSLIDPKVQIHCYSLAPVLSQVFHNEVVDNYGLPFGLQLQFFLKVCSWSLFHDWMWPQDMCEGGIKNIT